MSKPIIKLYHYSTPLSERKVFWFLTLDKQLASSYQNYRQASRDDLEQYGCLDLTFENVIIHCSDGFFEWAIGGEMDVFGNTYDGYVVVDNIKDRLLDRMEYLGFENSWEYEMFVSMSEEEVFQWLCNNDYTTLETKECVCS